MIEKSLADLTAAVEANTRALVAMQAGSATSGKGKAADAAIDAAAAAAVSSRDKARAPGKGKAVTIETIRERFGAYLAVEDKKVRDKRIADAKALYVKFGVAKASDLLPEDWESALKALAKLEAAAAAAAADDDDDAGDSAEDLC